MPRAQAKFFASSAEAGAFLANLVEPGDLLLVKGSRGVKMERIVESVERHAPTRRAGATSPRAGARH